MNASYIAVTTTAPTQEMAQAIADHLVEHRLAACVQVSGPISSTYLWKDEIHRDSEWLCTIKTTQQVYAQVEAAIIKIHSYETPEIICTEITGGLPAYLSWIGENVGPN